MNHLSRITLKGIHGRLSSSLTCVSWVYVAVLYKAAQGIGGVLDALRELKLERNTLVVFTSDNGAEWQTGKKPDEQTRGEKQFGRQASLGGRESVTTHP